MSRIKKIQCFILIISIVALSVFVSANTVFAGQRMSSLMLSDAEYSSLKADRGRSAKPIVGDIKFNDYSLFLDANRNVYYYSVIQGGISAFDPIVTADFDGDDIKIAFKQGEITDDLIKNADELFFTVYSDNFYTEYALSVTTLPIVSITLDKEPENISNPIPDDKQYVCAQFNIFDNSAEATHLTRVVNSQGKIRLRGATSTSYEKKGYRFQLYNESLGGSMRNNNVSLLGLRADDDWILYPAYNDPEKVRNVLSTDIWNIMSGTNNEFGMSTASQSRLCEVLINGRYWGMYALMYPVDEIQFKLSENKDTGKSDFWWRSVGYVSATTEDFLNAADSAKTVGRFEIRFPQETEGMGYNKWEVIAKFNELLETEDEDYFASTFTDVIDLDNQIDLWLFLKITQAVDNCGSNTNYVAKYRDGKYTIYCSPWDLDQTWGLCWKNGVFTNTDVIIEPNDPINNYDFYMIISRCMEMEMTNIAQKVMERYEYLRSEVITDQKLSELVDYYETQVYDSGAAIRESKRWPISRVADNMDDLRRRVEEHMTFLDVHIAELDRTFGEV